MNSTLPKSVIIVAGGSGTRMGSETPKQFLLLAGKPVLMHTIQKFYGFDTGIQIVLVLPFQHIETWNRLCSEYRFLLPHQIAAGGKERFSSVKNGLDLIESNGFVAIHDGVRPLVTEKVIASCFEAAAIHGGAIPVIKPAESLRQLKGTISSPVEREKFRLVQTPQVFKVELIKKAYKKDFEKQFTDDATVFEAAGYRVKLIEGNPENIKITWPADMVMAESLISK